MLLRRVAISGRDFIPIEYVFGGQLGVETGERTRDMISLSGIRRFEMTTNGGGF